MKLKRETKDSNLYFNEVTKVAFILSRSSAWKEFLAIAAHSSSSISQRDAISFAAIQTIELSISLGTRDEPFSPKAKPIALSSSSLHPSTP